MRLKLISCEILYREICAAIARAPHQIDVEFMPKGLHDIAGKGMCERIQAVLDEVDESRYEAIILGYALCGMGLAGLTARTKPVVLPRGHACITLFLGSRQRYQEYFDGNPGVYFKTTGWIERGRDLNQVGSDTYKKMGFGQTMEELTAKYGEDNARYLWEQMGGYTSNYGKLTFIEMGIEPDDSFEHQVREEAATSSMQYEKLTGSMGLFERLVRAEWNDDEFLIVPPGHRIAARHDDQIVGVEEAS